MRCAKKVRKYGIRGHDHISPHFFVLYVSRCAWCVVIGSIPFMFAIISISVLTFGYTNYELKAIYQQQLYGGGNNHHVRSYERKLKLERNWWIALFSSVCWLCVYVLNERTRELDKLRAQLKNK